MTERTTATPEDAIARNLNNVQDAIVAACARAGREPSTVNLIVVTKQRSPGEIVLALKHGVRHIGENRVEEASQKFGAVRDQLPPGIEPPVWHMIGHVQSRKARDVVEHFAVIHSLDRLKLAQRYQRFAEETDTRPRVLLEMNVSGEESKQGVLAADWENSAVIRQSLWEFVARLVGLSHLQIVGLMTMAPYWSEAERTRPVFATLRKLRDALREDFPQLAWRELSMGMTNDYPIAIEEGATMVRIGRAIFGERSK